MARSNDELDPIERKHRAWFGRKYCVICGASSTAISKGGLSICYRHVNSPACQTRYDWLTGELLTDEYLVVPHWMWQWHVGAEPASACETCGERTNRILFRGGERIGRFCALHAPDRPYHDPTACVDCGGSSRWIDRDGQQRCDEHHRSLDSDDDE